MQFYTGPFIQCRSKNLQRLLDVLCGRTTLMSMGAREHKPTEGYLVVQLWKLVKKRDIYAPRYVGVP